jgi:hypothetical protein
VLGGVQGTPIVPAQNHWAGQQVVVVVLVVDVVVVVVVDVVDVVEVVLVVVVVPPWQGVWISSQSSWPANAGEMHEQEGRHGFSSRDQSLDVVDQRQVQASVQGFGVVEVVVVVE